MRQVSKVLEQEVRRVRLDSKGNIFKSADTQEATATTRQRACVVSPAATTVCKYL